MNLFRYPILLIIFSALLFSCNKDEEAIKLGELNFFQINDLDTLENEVFFSIEAENNTAIASVAVFLNDELFETKLSAPFEFTWNTLQYEDGNYSIKAVVTDKKGNQPEKVIHTTVHNSLFEFHDDFYNIQSGEKEYIVVTDPEGNILNWRELQSKPNFKLYPKSSYTGKTINLYKIKNGSYNNIVAYLNLKKGSSWKPVRNWVPAFHGKIDLNIKNAEAGFDYLSYGLGWGKTLTSLQDTLFTVREYYEGGKIYAQIVKENQGHYDFFDIDPTKSSFDIDYSALSSTSTKKTIQVPEHGHGSFHLYAFKEIDGNPHFYRFFNRNYQGSSFDIFYPEIPTFTYSSFITFREEGIIHSYSNSGNIISEFRLMQAKAEVIDPRPDQFKASFTGDFDYYFIHFSIPGWKKNLHVYSAKAISAFKIPDFSASLPVDKFEMDDLVIRELKLTKMEGHIENEAYFEYYSKQPLPVYPNVTTMLYTNINK